MLHKDNDFEIEKLLQKKVELSDLIGEKSASVSDIVPGTHSTKLVHLSSLDHGGAGKAAYRLHKGLQSVETDSLMLVVDKVSTDSSVKQLYCKTSIDTFLKQCESTLTSKYPGRRCGQEIFTYTSPETHFETVREIHEADIIHLHWVAGLIDYRNLPKILKDKPIVWTLHDMNPFTGGCHYSGTCEKYMTICGACPQLGSNDTEDLSYQTYLQKLEFYKDLNIHIVTPSQWLGYCASKSSLFRRFPVEVIPYGLPLDIFEPMAKEDIRKELRIPEKAKVVLFGADSITNERKGFKFLLEAIDELSREGKSDDIILLTFGHLPDDSNLKSKFPIYNLGRIETERQVAIAYNAADVFVLPSIEDNLPNTVIEALACGIPVVGFRIGGLPDMVEQFKTGYLAKPEDTNELIEGIARIISLGAKIEDLSQQCREKAIQEYGLDVQARRYTELYKTLLNHHATGPKTRDNHPALLDRFNNQRVHPEIFANFSYSKKSHFECFKDHDLSLYNKKISYKNCDLKVYQDLLAYTFVIENIPKGSRILEVGGGDSRVLKAIKNNYECWNIDKLEGRGNGLTSVGAAGYRVIKSYMGEFSNELPDHYFDFVFSISVLEHVGDKKQTFQNICLDIDRVLKSGGYSLHCLDIVIKEDEVRAHSIIPFIFKNYETVNTLIPLRKIQSDKDLFYMSRQAYVNGWEQFTKKPYESFGKPVSYNILWRKQYIDSFAGYENSRPIINVKSYAPRITIVTPSYNQGEFLEECIDSILSQNYPNLQYIIMDGGSTDGSVEIIKKYKKYLAYWQSKPDGGQYNAINQGFKKSTGQVMAWLNSDDKYHDNSLFKTAYIFQKYPSVEWLTGRPTAWNEKGELVRVFGDLPLWDREKYLKKIFKKICIQQESTFWRKSLWMKAGSYLRTDLQFAGDLELWVRFFRYARLYTIDTLLGGYRYQPHQKTNLYMQNYIEEGEKIVDQEISEIQNDEFRLMLNAPQPLSFNEVEFNNFQQSIHKDRKATHQINSRTHMNCIHLPSNSNYTPTIATSISPRDIDKQQQAIQSWLNIGFNVVSMNCDDEIKIINKYFPEVKFIVAKRDAMQSMGKPLVYIDDLFNYLKQKNVEVGGIINSDIYLLQDRAFLNLIKKETKSSLIYGSRIEVDSFKHLQGEIYERGFDVFFFSNSVFSNIPSSDFCLGTTWWDYWVPLVLSLKKYPIKKIVSPFAFHKKHQYNWNREEFVYAGRKVLQFLYDQSFKEIDSNYSENNWISFNFEFLKFSHMHFSENAFSKSEKDLLLFRYIQCLAEYILKFLKINSAEIISPEKSRLELKANS